MSEHPAPRPEDEQPESHELPSSEPAPQSLPAKSEAHWLSQVLSLAFLFVVSTALFYPSTKPYRTEGATRSAQAERADRLREIAEAQRLADQSDADR